MATAYGLDPFQASQAQIEAVSDHANDAHRGHDEVVAVSGVARVDDQVSEPGVDRHHLRRDDDQPRDAESNSHAGHDLRHGGRDDDPHEQLRAGDAEVLGSADVLTLDSMDAGDRSDHHREE